MVTLLNGRVVTYDLYQVTRNEYINFVSGKLTTEEDESFIARASGLTVDEVQKLSLQEWKMLIAGLYAEVRKPIEADPKLAKESTSG